MKRLMTIALCMLSGLFLALVGYIAGSYVQTELDKKAKAQTIDVGTIAVVNMDSGVEIGNENINYASQLMDLSDGTYVIKGLNDAKRGVEDGSYAAYIVIPDQFSASVADFENNPGTMTLQYHFNNKLSAESKVMATNNVNMFIRTLNTNVAYMYVDAILAEYHRVQDDTNSLLANQAADLKGLEAINADDMIVGMEVAETVTVNQDIPSIDLAYYTGANAEYLSGLNQDYQDAIKAANADFAKIKLQQVACQAATDKVFKEYTDFLATTTDSQKDVYAEINELIKNKVAVNNKKNEEKNEYVKNTFGTAIKTQREKDQTVVDGVYSNYEGADKKYVEWDNYFNSVEEQIFDKMWSYYNADFEVNDSESIKGVKASSRRAYMQGYYAGVDAAYNVVEAELNSTEADFEATFSENKNATQTDSTPGMSKSECFQLVAGKIQGLKEKALVYNNATNYLAAEYRVYNDENQEREDKLRLINDIYDWNNITANKPGRYKPGEAGKTDPSEVTTEENSFEKASVNVANKNYNGNGNNNESNLPDGDIDPPFTIPAKPELANWMSDDEIENVSGTIIAGFDLNDASAEIDTILNTKLNTELKKVNQKKYDGIKTNALNVQRDVNSYMKNIENHNPYDYIQKANLGEYVKAINSNTGEMEKVLHQNNSDYQRYTMEVCTAATENSSQYKVKLDKAYELTSANITRSVNELIEERQQTNEENVSKLKGFSDSLLYTRVASQANSKVYNYIVNPVISEEVDKTVIAQTELNNDYIKRVIMLTLGVAVLICCVAIIGMVKKASVRDEDYE